MSFSGEIHPAAELFPMMSEAELQELAEDIRTNGLRNPIALTEDGAILDGRNRVAACKIAGVEPEFISVNGSDPVAFVVSLNVKRRNLTASQRAVAAAEAWDLTSPKDGGKQGRAGALAMTFGISHGYIQQARALVERDPDAAGTVKGGAMPLSEAYEALLARERDTKMREASLEGLREKYPDLAEMVDAGKLTLAEAGAAAKQRDAEEKEERQTKTKVLMDLVSLATPVGHVERYVELYDRTFDPHESVTADKLRDTAAFALAVAEKIEGGEA